MAEQPAAQAPRITKAQRLWLLELGLDRPLLARLSPQTDQNKGVSITSPGAAVSSTRASHHGSRADAGHTGSSYSAQDSPAAAALAALRPNRKAGSTTKAIRPDTATQQHHVTDHAARDVPSHADSAKSATKEALGGSTAEPLWQALNNQIDACTACDLHTGRFKAVAGAGATQAGGWLVVGEAPGDRDERVGEPFQGKAGQLLHAMLQAVGIHTQDEVFYTNLVKCRPLNNRPPTTEQIAACNAHLRQQVALLQPSGILALGRLAAQALVGNDRPFEELRGQTHHVSSETGDQIPVIITYHPASLLSRPQHKAEAWRDLIKARDSFSA